jgi:hypothetical protein
MIWSEILKLYLNAVGDAPAAYTERWLHLNTSYRKVASNLDVDQLEEDVSVLTTTAGVDYVTLPTDVFHVLSCHNTTNGYPVQPEPSGMRGRERYYAALTGMPDSGQPLFYATTNGKLYLRNTPDAVYSLNLRYKIQPPSVSDTDLASSPLTPSEWDFSVIAGAAANFMLIHPDADQSYGDGQAPRSILLKQAADSGMAEIPLPKDKERADQRGRMYIPIFMRR